MGRHTLMYLQLAGSREQKYFDKVAGQKDYRIILGVVLQNLLGINLHFFDKLECFAKVKRFLAKSRIDSNYMCLRVVTGYSGRILSCLHSISLGHWFVSSS